MRKIAFAIISIALYTSAIGRMFPVWGAETENELYYDYSWYSEKLEINDEWNDIIKEGSKNPTTMYSIANNVNVRELPNTSSKIFDKLHRNTTVEVIGEKEGWSCITTCDGIAFVSSQYLDSEECKLVSLGDFRLSFYCCEQHHHICNDGTQLTKMGTQVREGIVSVDPKVIPLGSKLIINGVEYSAEDTGSRIKGNKLDVCVPTHKEALGKGVYYAEVFLVCE